MKRKHLILVLIAIMSTFLFLAACDKTGGNNSGDSGNSSYQNVEQEVSYQGIKYAFGIDGKGYRVVGVEDKNLTEATIANEINGVPVTHIAQHAFDGCYMLKSVYIQNGLGIILPYAFKDCVSLESITIPDSVTAICQNAFENCTALSDMIIGEGINYVGENAFLGCNSIIKVKAPANLVGSENFPKKSLQEVELTSGEVNSICFTGATSLERITIGEGVTYIKKGGLGGCASLESITVSENNKNYCSVKGILYNKDKTAIFTVPQKTNGTVTIPDSVTTIEYFAFYGCANVTNVIIPDSVTNIGYGAFNNCASLTEVTLPDNVTYIDDKAFNNCSSLTEVTLPDNVTYIGDSAFSGCSSLRYNEYDNALYLGNETNPYLVLVAAKDKNITSCIINEHTKILNSSAFSGCKALTDMAIPDSVTAIGNQAFRNCTSLSNIMIGNGVTAIGERAFYGCSSLTDITIPDSVISIEYNAFCGCTSLTNVTMSENVIYVGYDAFSGCNSLQYNEYENALYLGNGNNPYLALIKAKSTSITTCTIHEDTTVVCDNAFENCSRLQYNEYDHAKYIGSASNPYFVMIQSIGLGYYCNINENTKFIHSGAFSLITQNSNLVRITIPDSVISIGYNAFKLNPNLKSVTIGNGIKHISNTAFTSCPAIRNVKINSQSLDPASFFYITRL